MVGDGDRAADDPHEAQTLEWTTTSPAPSMNFAEAPTVMSAEPVLDSHPYAVDTPGSDS
jgi:heme/copper-type cytochrome/quinol oxidase subunit 1